MTIKIKNPKQLNFIKDSKTHRFASGGTLRQSRKGRKQRPLSCKETLHVVFKADSSRLRSRSFRRNKEFILIQKIIKHYAERFHVKIDQLTIQHDHIHCLIRTSKRSFFHYFFRVVAGQIAQRFEQEGLLTLKVVLNKKPVTGTPNEAPKPPRSLWKYRPFSRVVRSFTALKIVRNYLQLNEQEVRGLIPYNILRLKGLSEYQWKILWC
jgi:putative transposase